MRLLPVLLLLVVALYWPGLSGEFVFDDQANIVSNPSLRAFDGSFSSLVEAAGGGAASPLGRPISLASFAANLHFWGESPFHFKLVNLLIHLSNGLLVFVLARSLWKGIVKDDRGGLAALWVSAVWLLHPINLTPVLYVVQRMTGLATLFTLAALCLYLYGRRSAGTKRWLSLAVALLVFWPAGTLSKEIALSLPLLILLSEWLALGSFDRAGPAIGWLWVSVLGLLVAVALFSGWGLIASTYQARDFTIAERLLTEARVLWLYVQQILLPLPDSYSLHHDDIPISRGWFDPPSTAFAVLGWILIIGFAVSQRRKRPWMTFAVGWFLAGHLLESSVIGLEIAYEHRNYLPSVGVIFGAAGMLMPVVADARGKLTRLVLAIGTVALCAVVTGVRAAQWGDEYIRTQIESSTHPASARTHYDAARAILDRELPTGEIGTVAYYMARTHFLRAARYDPDNKAALAGILYLDCATGAGKDSNVLKEFLDRLENRRFTNGEQGFIQSLSNILVHDAMCLGAPDIDAVLAAALSNPTARGRTRGMLHAVAMDYAEAGRGSLDQARTHATAAVESDPANAVLRINLIRVLLHLNEIDEAKRQYASLTSLYVPPAARGEVMSLEQLLRATEHRGR